MINTTQNTTAVTGLNTDSLQYPHRSNLSLAIQTVIIVLLAIFNSIGNTTIVFAILRAPALRRRASNALIASLAVSDFFMVGEMIFRLVLLHDVQAAEPVCEALSAVLFILVLVSILHLAALSCDRYVAIIYPLRYHSIVTARTMKIVLPSVWLTPILPVALSTLFTESAGFRSSTIGCPVPWKTSPVGHQFYVFIFALIFIGFPSGIMIAASSRIAWISYYQTRRIVEPEFQDPEEAAVTQERKKKSKKEMKWAKTLGIVNGAFFVSYVPGYIVSVLRVKYGSNFLLDHDWLVPLGTTFLFLNSALNPVIYSFRSREFRKPFLRLLGYQPTLEMSRRALEGTQAPSIS